MSWQKVKISSFLKEREDRIKPDEANEMGLNRLEKIDFSGNIHINTNKPTRTGMILVKKGDLVISGINVEKGALAIYEGNDDLLATIHYSSYSYDKNRIDIEFLKWFLKSDAFKSAINSQTKGGIKTELKPKRFLPLEIDLPDLNTQIEIRQRLNSVNSEINETVNIQYQNENYISKLRQAILSEAVSGKLVPQDSNDESANVLLEKIKAEKDNLVKDKKIRKEKTLPPITDEEIPYDLPKGWEWVRLGDIANYGHVEKIESKDIYSDEWLLDLEDIEKITSKLLVKKKFKENPSKSSKNKFIRGDILYGKLRPYLDKVIVAEENGVCTTEIVPIRPFIINSYYLRWYLKNKEFISYVNSLTYGVKMPRLGTSDAERSLVSVPPLNEQKRIVEKIDQLMKLCDELEEQVKKNQTNSEKLMNAVLREAFEV
jgi:type I restriction enzyme, S subunit